MIDVRNSLPAYQGLETVLVQHQLTSDIMDAILALHKEEQNSYDKIADKYFWKGNVKDTAKYLFDFMKKNVRYDIETKDEQTVKRPQAILAEGYGDCKHYASFIVGIADALHRKGYPISGSYMFVNSYDKSDSFHHVFAVITDTETGKEYWVDPIYKEFDKRKKYLSFKRNDMALKVISGEQVGAKKTKAQRRAGRQANRQARQANRTARRQQRQAIRALPKPERKAARKQVRQQRSAARKEVRKNVKGGQKVAHVLMKAPNAVSRNAFLALVKMNAFRMASKMAAKANADANWKKELTGKWYEAGGDWLKLKQAINQGVNVWNAKHTPAVAAIGFIDPSTPFPLYYPGYEPKPIQAWQEPICNCKDLEEAEERMAGVMGDGGASGAIVAAAIVAAAAPIIIKLLSLLKRSGVDTDAVQEGVDEAKDETYEEIEDIKDYGYDPDLDDYNKSDRTNNSQFPQFGIKTYENGDGTATVEYTKTNIDDNGDVNTGLFSDGIENIKYQLQDFYYNNKRLVWGGVGLLVGVPIVRSIIQSLPKKRRR